MPGLYRLLQALPTYVQVVQAISTQPKQECLVIHGQLVLAVPLQLEQVRTASLLAGLLPVPEALLLIIQTQMAALH